MRKVAIVGSSGSGKTSLARTLAQRLAVPHVELDALHHGPGWTELPDFVERVEEALCGGGWVVDGSYERKLGSRVLDAADTVVWLDLPLRTTLPRLLRRTLRRIRAGEELWNGNRETWRGAFWGRDALFAWTLRHHRRRRRVYPERFARHAHLAVVRLRSDREVQAWLDGLSG